MGSTATIECPYCKEDIKQGAIKCKHCGEMLGGTPEGPPPLERQPVGTGDLKAPSVKKATTSSLKLPAPKMTRVSIVRMILLMVATKGIYYALWLHQRIPEFNQHRSDKKIDPNIGYLAIGLAVILDVLYFIQPNSGTGMFVGLAFWAIAISMAFRIRSIVIDHTKGRSNNTLVLSPFWTFCPGFFYIQHQVNKQFSTPIPKPKFPTWAVGTIALIMLVFSAPSATNDTNVPQASSPSKAVEAAQTPAKSQVKHEPNQLSAKQEPEGVPVKTQAEPEPPRVVPAKNMETYANLAANFKNMTEIQQKAWNESNEWKHWVKGNGTVSQVEEAGILSGIQGDYFEVTVEVNDNFRAVVFYPKEKYKQVVGKMAKGSKLSFEGNLQKFYDQALWVSGDIKVE